MPPVWISEFCRVLGCPESNVNVFALRLWARSEGVNPSYHNPLATSLALSGSHPFNGDGVRVYASDSQGGEAAALTLLRTRGVGYEPVVAAFRRGNDMAGIWRGINRSSWCRGCQGGRYPVVLADALHNGGRVPHNSASRPIEIPARNVAELRWDYSDVISYMTRGERDQSRYLHGIGKAFAALNRTIARERF